MFGDAFDFQQALPHASGMDYPRLISLMMEAGRHDQTALGERLGVSQSTVSKWKRGKQEPEVGQYQKLIQVAQEMVAMGGEHAEAIGELLGGKEISKNAKVPERGGTPLKELPVAGVVEAGAFREVEMFAGTSERSIPVPRHEDFPKAQQMAYEIKGDSMDLAGLVEGYYVSAVDYIDFVDVKGEPPNGTMVVVERCDGGHLYEMTVKELHRAGRTYELRPKSSNPAHKPYFIKHTQTEDAPSIRIVAVVTGIHRFFRF